MPKPSSITFSAALSTALMLPTCALAVDIDGVLPAALDQPRVNVAIEVNGEILTFGNGNDPAFFFPMWAFLDTGASGILISADTAGFLLVPDDDGVQFGDVGIGEDPTFFGVSESITLHIAPQTPAVIAQEVFPNEPNFFQVYNSSTANVRAQLGVPRVSEPPDPIDILLNSLDVVGMPVMQNKVVVMNPRPVNNVLPLITNPNAEIDIDLNDIYIQTTLYDADDTGAPIPETTHTVKLSYSDFDQFTVTTPNGAQPPTLHRNPFIGPAPVQNGNGQFNDAPPVKLFFGDEEADASMLLDTGAAASLISSEIAAQLGIGYADNKGPSSVPGATVELTGIDLDQQLTTTVAGINGAITIAGFPLEALLLKTEQGDAANDDDPNHIRFNDAIVYVYDIEYSEGETLDGIFGMNFLTASTLFVGTGINDFAFLAGRESPFNWVVFDEPNGELRLTLVPEPAMSGLFAGIATTLLLRRHRL